MWSSAPVAGLQTKGSDGWRDDCLRGPVEAGRFSAGTMNERRVVITGIGCLSPLGNDLTSTWEGMKAGRSGISRITQLDPEPFDCKIAGEVKNFEPDGYFNVLVKIVIVEFLDQRH